MSLQFKYVPAEDESVDPEYRLIKDGVETEIHIQDCRSYGGGYSVERITNPDTNDICLTYLGEAKTLKRAKELAIAASMLKKVV